MDNQPIYAVMDLTTGRFVELDIAHHVHLTLAPSSNAVTLSIAGATQMKNVFFQQLDETIRCLDERIKQLESMPEPDGPMWGEDLETFRANNQAEVARLTVRKEMVVQQKRTAKFVVVELLYRVVDEDATMGTNAELLCPFPEDGFSAKVCFNADGKQTGCNLSGVRRPD